MVASQRNLRAQRHFFDKMSPLVHGGDAQVGAAQVHSDCEPAHSNFAFFTEFACTVCTAADTGRQLLNRYTTAISGISDSNGCSALRPEFAGLRSRISGTSRLRARRRGAPPETFPLLHPRSRNLKSKSRPP